MAGRGRGQALRDALLAKAKSEAAIGNLASYDVKVEVGHGRGHFARQLKSRAASLSPAPGFTTADSGIESGAATTVGQLTRSLTQGLHSTMSGKTSTISSTSRPPSRTDFELSLLQEEPTLDYRGTAGVPLKIETNYMRLNRTTTTLGIYEFEVCFDPQLDHRGERFHCLYQHGDLIGNARTFDGVKLSLPFLLTKSV
jgi:hypothetical protein